MNIKITTKEILIFVISILSISIWIYIKKYESLKYKYSNAIINIKAYENENSKFKNNERVFKYTAEQLEYSNDSITQKLDSVRKLLKIKNKNLEGIGYIESNISRKDTIDLSKSTNKNIFKKSKDTIYIDLDTLINQKWYKLNLSIHYPKIIINPEFISEKYIIASLKRETINPPKKFFLFRWFQKKQNILNVKVIENNPNIKEGTQKFIQIIK